MKIVLNDCYGGFGISAFGMSKLAERKGLTLYFYEEDYEAFIYRRVDTPEIKNDWCPLSLTKDVGDTVSMGELYPQYSDLLFRSDDVERTDPDLIFLVETYGDKMDDMCSKLKVIEIPDDVEYDITDYDGIEWVAEKHRTWS